jgi:hypothetical protein
LLVLFLEESKIRLYKKDERDGQFLLI